MNTFSTFILCAAAFLLPACHDSADRPATAADDIRTMLHTHDNKKPFLEPEEREMLANYLRTGDPKPALENGGTLLHLACELNSPALVAELLARGADVNALQRNRYDPFRLEECGGLRAGELSPLVLAASPAFYGCAYYKKGGASVADSIRIIDMLLAAGADRRLGDNPLAYALDGRLDFVRDEEIFLHLLDCGFSLNDANLTPEQRAGIPHDLRDCQWTRAMERLGIPATAPAPVDNTPIAATDSAAQPDFHRLPERVSISSVVLDRHQPDGVSVSLRNHTDEDIRISLKSEAGVEQLIAPQFAIGERRFRTIGLPEEIRIPARGTQSLRFELDASMPCNYDTLRKLHNGTRINISIALRQGGGIRFGYPVQTWEQGGQRHLNHDGGHVLLEYTDPKAEAKNVSDPLPEGPYKVGEAALADIRSIYETDRCQERFSLPKGARQALENYLRTGEATPQLLRLACEYNCPDLVAELIARGVEVNETTTYWDMLDCDENGRESSRFSFRSPYFDAALPSSYTGAATPEKAIRILNMLHAAGADTKLGDSPLPYVARVALCHNHFEEVFLRLLDLGFTLDEERRSPEPSAEQRARIERAGGTLAPACITPRHRLQIYHYLLSMREIGCPWERVEQRLGLTPEIIRARIDAEGVTRPPFPEPAEEAMDGDTMGNARLEPLDEEDNAQIRQVLTNATRIRVARGSAEAVELLPAEASTLLATLRAVPFWYRGTENPGHDIRISFCDAEGKPLAADAQNLAYTVRKGDPAGLADIARRYLPEDAPSLPPAQQIKVLGKPGQEIFVYAGRTLTTRAALCEQAADAQACELYFYHKRSAEEARALADELKDCIRIKQLNYPSPYARNNRRDLITLIAEAADFDLGEGEEPSFYSISGEFCFRPLDDSDTLRDALTRCAAVSFEQTSGLPTNRSGIISRREPGLEQLLQQLAAETRWYEARPNRYHGISFFHEGKLSLLDDDGKALWQGDVNLVRYLPDEDPDSEFPNEPVSLMYHLDSYLTEPAN